MVVDPNQIPPVLDPVPTGKQNILVKRLSTRHVWLSLIPSVVIPFRLFLIDTEWGPIDWLWVALTSVWCAGAAFPMTRGAPSPAGRAVLLGLLVPGLVILNLGAGVFAGCCVGGAVTAIHEAARSIR